MISFAISLLGVALHLQNCMATVITTHRSPGYGPMEFDIVLPQWHNDFTCNGHLFRIQKLQKSNLYTGTDTPACNDWGNLTASDGSEIRLADLGLVKVDDEHHNIKAQLPCLRDQDYVNDLYCCPAAGVWQPLDGSGGWQSCT